jgi:predicted oxidoreductase
VGVSIPDEGVDVTTTTPHQTDVLVIVGPAGLVAASEAAAAGRRVIVDQEPRTNLGGQAFWSSAGCSSSTPEQRRMGISDS